MSGGCLQEKGLVVPCAAMGGKATAAGRSQTRREKKPGPTRAPLGYREQSRGTHLSGYLGGGQCLEAGLAGGDEEAADILFLGLGAGHASVSSLCTCGGPLFCDVHWTSVELVEERESQSERLPGTAGWGGLPSSLHGSSRHETGTTSDWNRVSFYPTPRTGSSTQ